MDNLCRLCCSERFVNNDIFDEENALHLKMSLYLPIKIAKDDRLPQKICDKCSCNVNDFYQFCNESIEAQNKLKSLLPSKCSDIEDLEKQTKTNNNDSEVSETKSGVMDRSTQTEILYEEKTKCDKPESSTSAEVPAVVVKQEPVDNVKLEEDSQLESYEVNNYESDSSENVSLLNLKLAKDHSSTEKKTNDTPKKKHSIRRTENGSKKTHKRKSDLNNLAPFINAIPKGTSIAVVREGLSQQLKLEMKQEVEEVELNDMGIDMKCFNVKKVKKEKDQMYVCCVCFNEYGSRKEILAHYRSHADESQLRSSPPPPPPPPAPLPAPCPRCNKEVREGSWGGHWARHWELDRRPYRCQRCSATFRDHAAIFKHGMRCTTIKKQKSDDPYEVMMYVCDLCPEQFEYLKCLKAHRTQSHPSISRPLRLACPLCARGFLHMNSLRRHVRGHSGRRDFLCNICGKGLSSAEHLKSHIQIHENVKPNVCKTCGKAFVKKTNLTMHERVHSGEKPYVCPHCGKAFSQRSTLVIHERYHSGSRPYVCGLCGRGFVARGLLSMHLKVACI